LFSIPVFSSPSTTSATRSAAAVERFLAGEWVPVFFRSPLPLWVEFTLGTVGGWARLHAPVWVLAVELAPTTAVLAPVLAVNEIWGVQG
jgi:hypothetical protein